MLGTWEVTSHVYQLEWNGPSMVLTISNFPSWIFVPISRWRPGHRKSKVVGAQWITKMCLKDSW